MSKWSTTVLLAVGLAGCGGLEPQEEEMLVVHQQNSKYYYDRGDLGRSEQQCRLGLDIDPEDFSLNLTLAYVLVRQATPESLDEADELLDRLEDERSDDFRVHLGLGLVSHSRFRAAEDPEDPEVRALLARSRGHLEEVMELEPDCTEAIFHLSLIDLQEERSDLFIEHSDRTIELIVRSIRAKNLALERVDRREQRVLIERDRGVDLSRGRQLLLLRAAQSYDDGRLEEALADLDRLTELGELTRPDYFNRARILEQLGQLERAVADYEKFIELSSGGLDPNVESALENLFALRARLAEQRTKGGSGG